jgi:hypothetical protein
MPALHELIKILIQEEEENFTEMTAGDCLEYLLHNRIFEILCSYVATDKPDGFLPRGIECLQ